MERPVIRDEAMDTKIKEALKFVEKNHPEEKKLIDRRLKYIVLIGGEFYDGDVIIHDFKGESIMGEYHIHIDKVRELSVSDLAERLSLVAAVINSKAGVRIGSSWTFPGLEIESLIASVGSLCHV